MKTYRFWNNLTDEQKDKLLEWIVSKTFTSDEIAEILDVTIEP